MRYSSRCLDHFLGVGLAVGGVLQTGALTITKDWMENPRIGQRALLNTIIPHYCRNRHVDTGNGNLFLECVSVVMNY